MRKSKGGGEQSCKASVIDYMSPLSAGGIGLKSVSSPSLRKTGASASGGSREQDSSESRVGEYLASRAEGGCGCAGWACEDATGSKWGWDVFDELELAVVCSSG